MMDGENKTLRMLVIKIDGPDVIISMMQVDTFRTPACGSTIVPKLPIIIMVADTGLKGTTAFYGKLTTVQKVFEREPCAGMTRTM